MDADDIDLTDARLIAAADQVVARHGQIQRDRGLDHEDARRCTGAEYERDYGPDSPEAVMARYYRDHWGPDLSAGPADEPHTREE